MQHISLVLYLSEGHRGKEKEEGVKVESNTTQTNPVWKSVKTKLQPCKRLGAK